MRIQQTSPERFPSGRPRVIAVLKLEPTELFSRFGLTFQEAHDDLDDFLFCTFKEKDIGQVLLLRYENSPTPGTEVSVDSMHDIRKALDVLIDLFELKPEDVTWTAI